MSLGPRIRGTWRALSLAEIHGRSKPWTNHTSWNQMGWKNQGTCGSQECNSCRKAWSERGQGTSWEESKINSSTKKTKTGQSPFLKLEYTETSVGASNKEASKKPLQSKQTKEEGSSYSGRRWTPPFIPSSSASTSPNSTPCPHKSRNNSKK